MTQRDAVPRPPVLRIDPPLDPGDVEFLAGFAGVPVRDHEDRLVASDPVLSRVWPGQPRSAAPWAPCAAGCCLVPTGPVRSASPPGFAAQWLRFLLETFLVARHRVSGACAVAVEHRPPEVVLVEDGEVFEGVPDPVPDPVPPRVEVEDPWGGWSA